MDLNPSAKLNRIANGDSTIHASLYHTLRTFLVDT